MSNFYKETHKFYNISGFQVINSLRDALGDNNIYEPLKQRPWFTQTGQVFIRRDVADPALITYLLLKKT
jgi:hypothetical protein